MKMNNSALIKTLSDLSPDPKNANKGTERGSHMLTASLERFGAGRSILVDKHGTVIAGNKTLEHWAEIGMEEITVVPSDGKKLVVVQRTDLDLETDPEAKALGVADNRTSEIGLDYDLSVLAELTQEADLSAFWFPDELEELLAGVNESPNFDPVSADEQGRLDEKEPIRCPECGHTFVR